MLSKCLLELHQHGLLLKSDSVLPSVTTFVAGAPVRGSWWSHPASHQIFQTLEQLSHHPDVLVVKLVAGKDTLVDRCLWPAIYAIATAGEDWQWKGLTKDARTLYTALSAAGQVEAMGAVARSLEGRLLAHAEQFHTAAGHHSKRLESWVRWARRVGLEEPDLPILEAKRAIEGIFPAAKLPWKRTSAV
ncbi:MAG: hypothetical protein LAQ69_19040 [Acidobacteriia bacterium]|nr:hypothetical protein [Terriglobia bacterium]